MQKRLVWNKIQHLILFGWDTLPPLSLGLDHKGEMKQVNSLIRAVWVINEIAKTERELVVTTEWNIRVYKYCIFTKKEGNKLVDLQSC